MPNYNDYDPEDDEPSPATPSEPSASYTPAPAAPLANPVIKSFDTPAAPAVDTTPTAAAPAPAQPAEQSSVPDGPPPAAQPTPVQAAAPAPATAAPAQPPAAAPLAQSTEEPDDAPAASSSAGFESSNKERIQDYFARQAAALKYHVSQGGQTEVLPTGATVPKQDANGNLMYHPAVIQPFTRGDDGNGYRVSRDEYGNQHWFDLSQGAAGQDYHVDDQSGDKYVTTSGADGSSKREVIGQDPLVPAINDLRGQLQQHATTSAQADIDINQATNGVQGAGPLRSASLSDLRGEATQIGQQLKPLQQQLSDIQSYTPDGAEGVDAANIGEKKQLADQVAFKQQRLQQVQGEVDARDSTISDARQRRDGVAQQKQDAETQIGMLRRVQNMGGLESVQGTLKNLATTGALVDDNPTKDANTSRWKALASMGLIATVPAGDGTNNTVARVTPLGLSMLDADTQAAVKATPEKYAVTATDAPVPPHVARVAPLLPSMADTSAPDNDARQPQKPYTVAPDGSVHFDTTNTAKSILSAVKDGVLTKDNAQQYLTTADGANQPQNHYAVGDDGTLHLDPANAAAGLRTAAADGVISQDQLAAHLPAAQRAQAALTQANAAASANPAYAANLRTRADGLLQGVTNGVGPVAASPSELPGTAASSPPDKMVAKPGLVDQLDGLAGGILQGLASGAGTLIRGPIGQGVAAAYDLATGNTAGITKVSGSPEELQAKSWGDWLQHSADNQVPAAAKNSIGARVGGFIGSAAPYIAQGTFAPETLLPVLFSSGYQSQFEDAKSKLAEAAQKSGQPLDDAQVEHAAHVSGLLGGTINTVLGLPFEGAGGAVQRIFGGTGTAAISKGLTAAFEKTGASGVADILQRLGRAGIGEDALQGINAIKAQLSKTVLDRAGDVAKTAARDAAVGAGAQMGQNLIAQNFYDPSRGLFDGVAGQALSFGAMGAVSGGVRESGLASQAREANRILDPGESNSSGPGEGNLLTNGTRPTGSPLSAADAAKPVAGRVVASRPSDQPEGAPPQPSSAPPAGPGATSAPTQPQTVEESSLPPVPAALVAPRNVPSAPSASSRSTPASPQPAAPTAAGQASSPAPDDKEHADTIAALAEARDNQQALLDKSKSLTPEDRASVQATVDHLTGRINALSDQSQPSPVDSTPAGPARIVASSQPGEAAHHTAAREWIADERAAGRDPSVADVIKTRNLAPYNAKRLLAEQADAEEQATASVPAAGASTVDADPLAAATRAGSNGEAVPAPREVPQSSGAGESSARSEDSTKPTFSDHDAFANLVNSGAETDNPGGAASLPHQVLSHLRAAGVDVTAETSRAVHEQVADIAKLPEGERQRALEDLSWKHVPEDAESVTSNEPEAVDKPSEASEQAAPVSPLTPRAQAAQTQIAKIDALEASGKTLTNQQSGQRTAWQRLVAMETARAQKAEASQRALAQKAHDALAGKQATGESLTSDEAARLESAKAKLEISGDKSKPEPETLPSQVERPPTTVRGKVVQKRIETLTAQRKANGGFLDAADQSALRHAHDVLAFELNRQVLGKNPQPTSEAGKQAATAIQRFQEARDMGAELSGSRHAEWKNHLAVLENDFTRQRQAIDARPPDAVPTPSATPSKGTTSPSNTSDAAQPSTFKSGEVVKYKGRRATVENIDSERATVRVHAGESPTQPGVNLTAKRVTNADVSRLEKMPAATTAPGETSAAPATPAKPVVVPRQPGDNNAAAVAREWLGDQRAMGKWPTVQEVRRAGRTSLPDAERILAERRRAESQAAGVGSHDTPATRLANTAKYLEEFRRAEGDGQTLSPEQVALAGKMRAALTEAGVPAHEQPPFLAAEADATAKAQVAAMRPELRALGVRRVAYNATEAASGIEFAPDGTLRINASKVARSMSTVRDNQSKGRIDGTPEDWFAQALQHESFHGVGNEVARARGFVDAQGHANPEKFYDSLPNDALPDDFDKQGRASYGPDWEKMPTWQRKAEFVRMFLEGKYTGRITEALYKFIRPIVDYFQKMAAGKGVDPRFQEFVRPMEQRIEQAYATGGAPDALGTFKRPSRASVVKQSQLVRSLEAVAQDNPDNAAAVARYQSGREQLTEMQRQRALPLQEGETPRTFQMPAAPDGNDDVLDHVRHQGGIVSPKDAQAKPTYDPRTGDYDGAPTLGGFYHHAVYGGKMMPDQMAQTLHESHGIGDGSVDGMWNAIGQAVDQRRAGATERQTHAKLEKQASSFDKDALQPGTAKGKTLVHVENLAPGDRVQIGDQTLTVKGIDPETMDVELDDHSRYGVQKVAEGTALYVEKVQPAADAGNGDGRLAAARPDKLTGNLFGDDEPFDLRGEAASAPERVAAALADAKGTTPPTLRPGERGTGDLFQGDDQPFNLSGETAIDHDARQTEQERQARESAVAQARQDAEQGSLFSPRPTEEGTRSMGQVPLPTKETFAPPAPPEPLDAPAKAEKPATDLASIADFGEKIGGARKDTARPLGPRPKVEAPAANADQPAWQRKYVVAPETRRDYSTPGKAQLKPTGKFQVERTDGVHVRTPTFATVAEAQAAIPLIEAARNHGISSTRKADGSSDHHIFRKVGDHKRPVVKSGFASHDEATAYLATYPQEVIEHKFPFPERPWLDRLERTGGAPRTGNVTPTMFQDAFGFRGGEFGNWNKGGDGQAALNHAYDALHDLSDILGVSPKALSLNGELAIAFGARGHGGEGAGAAHYEPGHQVINMTKIKGAGSLAHEWFHALDHYLGRQDGKATDRTQAADARDASGRDPAYVRGEYVSHGFSRQSGVREELRGAMKGVFDAAVAKPGQFTVSGDKLADMHATQAKYVQGTLDDLRRQFITGHEYSRTKKAATSEQAAEFDRLAGTVARGDVGEKLNVAAKGGGRLSTWRNSYQPIEDLNALYKSVLGRSFATNDEGSQGKKLFWQIGSMKDAQQRVTNAGEAGQEQTTRPVTTDFLRESRKIDGQRASDYWSTAHEMGARSFESYVADKLENSARANDYLAHGTDNRLYALFGLKPYPEGEERAALNRAWQKVFDTIQEKPTSRGNALHAAEPEPIGVPGGRELRETRVPVPQDVFNRLGVPKGNVFADYTALARKHPEFFSDGHEAKAYVEHVMEAPTEILPGSQPDHRLVVRSNGDHKAVALEVEMRGGKYRVRSAHTLTDQQLAAKRVAAGPGATLGVSRVDPEAGQETPSRLLDTSRNVPPDDGSKATTPTATGQTARRGSTQLTLSPEDARPIQNYVRAIPEHLLYSQRDPETNKERYGRELQPHVTSLYGLTGGGDAPDAVRNAVAGHGPVKMKVGKLSLFSDPSKPFDVLKADVESPDLHALNGKLRSLEHQNDYPDYQPHMTLAYLKKGEGERYVGKNPFQGKELSFSDLTHSSADRVKTEIPLNVPAQGADGSGRLAAALPEAFMDEPVQTDGATGTPKKGFIDQAKDKLSAAGAQRDMEARLSEGFDANRTLAHYEGGKAHTSIRQAIPDALDRQAATAAVEAGYDPKVLAEDLAKVQASPNKKLAARYAPAYEHALANLPRLREATKGYRAIDAAQDAAAERAGLLARWQNRVKHIYNDPAAPESTLPIDHGFGSTPGFKKGADAIAAGTDPRSMDLADHTQGMVSRNQQLINEKRWQDGLFAMKAPSDGKPMLGDVVETSTKLNPDGTQSSTQKVPRGYEAVQAGGNVLTVHKDFAPLFKAFYNPSAIRASPVGRAALKAVAIARKYSLVLDTFHVGRIAFKELTLAGQVGYDKGLSILEYSDADLDRAVQDGDLDKDEADFARQHRPMAEELMAAGYNVGRMADNLGESVHVNVPGLSHFSHWTFNKLTRGAMLQSGLTALERNLKRFPERSRAQNVRQTVREMNEAFGNLGMQGPIKSATMQDVSKIAFLAPQWTVSQLLSQLRGMGQMARALYDAVRGKGMRLGNVGQSMAAGVLGLVVANQIINLGTRGKPTWKNEEEGHKFDAWLPGGPNNRGFFFSPLELPAEFAHALHKYVGGGESAVDALTHIASNKLSGPARAVKDLATGKDWKGQPYASMGERLTAAATDALPSPIPLGAFLQKNPKSPVGYGVNHQPGRVVKQALSMAGMKVDAAQSARAQMYQMAQPFRANGGGNAPHAASPYGDLRHLLDDNDLEGAAAEVRRLTTEGGRNVRTIGRALGIQEGGAVRSEFYTGSSKTEKRMFDTLTIPQRRLFYAARKEHLNIARRFQQVASRGAGALVEAD